MEYSLIVEKVCQVVATLMERDVTTIHAETGMVQDLSCESIDLLELGVALNRAFQIPVDDDTVFLTALRFHVVQGGAVQERLEAAYPHLSSARRHELETLMSASGAVHPLRVGDIADYIAAALTGK